jgi:hypothetical protein
MSRTRRVPLRPFWGEKDVGSSPLCRMRSADRCSRSRADCRSIVPRRGDLSPSPSLALFIPQSRACVGRRRAWNTLRRKKIGLRRERADWNKKAEALPPAAPTGSPDWRGRSAAWARAPRLATASGQQQECRPRFTERYIPGSRARGPASGPTKLHCEALPGVADPVTT